MENKPPRVQIFNNFAPFLAVLVLGLFNNEINNFDKDLVIKKE